VTELREKRKGKSEKGLRSNPALLFADRFSLFAIEEASR